MINSTCRIFFFFFTNIENQHNHSPRFFLLRETDESYDSQSGFLFCIGVSRVSDNEHHENYETLMRIRIV